MGRIGVVRRQQWQAKPPLSQMPLIFPVRTVLFKYTETEKCMTELECKGVLRGFQQAAFRKGLPDLPYNFLIGGDLNVYEGRGWENAVYDRKLVMAYIAYTSDSDQRLNDMTDLCMEFVKEHNNKIKVWTRKEQAEEAEVAEHQTEPCSEHQVQ